MTKILPSCLALVLLSLGAQAQANWYVDDDGVAPGSGTQADPYTSIHYAIAQPSTLDGHTIMVAPGTYTEYVVVNKKVHVFSSAGPVETVIQSPVADGTILFMFESNVVFDGFTLRGPALTMVYQDLGRTRNCILDGVGTTHTGFDIVNGSIINCTVTGCAIGVRSDIIFDGILTMRGSVVWGNDQDILDQNFSDMSVRYCAGLDGDSQWLDYGPGNVIGDPGLWAHDYSDVHLAPGSPCIDADNPNSTPDDDGTPPDIGALTYDAAYAFGPEAYCVAKPASGGCVPFISASGSASASSSQPFMIDANRIVENQLGVLFFGTADAHAPYLGGIRCVGTPIERTPPQLSGSTGAACSGSYSMDFNAHLQNLPGNAFAPGTLLFAQYWFRDPLDPTGFGTGLTDAVRFGVGL